jgi:hypothetical protein
LPLAAIKLVYGTTKIAQSCGQHFSKKILISVLKGNFIFNYCKWWFPPFLIAQVKQLAEKARAGKLAPNEFQGGTFR